MTTPKFDKKIGLIIFIGLIIALPLSYIGIIGSLFFIDQARHNQIEAATDKEVHDIISRLPTVELNSFMLWEGDSIATISIKDKGKVHFWYRAGDQPRIDSIYSIGKQSYTTRFQCERLNGEKKRVYAYDNVLSLKKGDPLTKLVGVEIASIRELVAKFDQLYEAISKLPVVPTEMETSQESGGLRSFIPNPDSRYAYKMSAFDSATCYAYVMEGGSF